MPVDGTTSDLWRRHSLRYLALFDHQRVSTVLAAGTDAARIVEPTERACGDRDVFSNADNVLRETSTLGDCGTLQDVRRYQLNFAKASLRLTNVREQT